MSQSTYIFIHDQKILLGLEKERRFNHIENRHYVFLGFGEIDKIKHLENIIIARDLKHNIEQYERFCSFTGWYALWKNDIIKSEYVNLFEYDITIDRRFNIMLDKIIRRNYDFIGYVPQSMKFAYIDRPEYLAGIIPCIEKHYQVDINKMIHSIARSDRNALWSSTSNSTFNIATFNEYMIWFEKLIDDLKDNKMCGHAHERSISFFYLIFNKKVFFANGVLNHLMLNSHSEIKKHKVE